MNSFDTFRKFLSCIGLLAGLETSVWAQQATQIQLKATNKEYKIQYNQIKLEWNIKIKQQDIEIWRSHLTPSELSKSFNLSNLQFIKLPQVNTKNDSIDSYIDRNIEHGRYYYKLRIGKVVSNIAEGEAIFNAAEPTDSIKQLCDIQLNFLDVAKMDTAQYELSYEYAHTCAQPHEVMVFLSEDKVLDAQDVKVAIVRQSPQKLVIALSKVKNTQSFLILTVGNQIDILPIKN